MFNILIIDDMSFYSEGEHAKVFVTEEEAQATIIGLQEMEKKLFGDNTIEYRVVNVSE